MTKLRLVLCIVCRRVSCLGDWGGQQGRAAREEGNEEEDVSLDRKPNWDAHTDCGAATERVL